MKKLIAIALPTFFFNSYATAEQVAEPKKPYTGHIEISIQDLPEGSAENLDAAIKAYNKRITDEGPGIIGAKNANDARRVVNVKNKTLAVSQDYIYSVEDATLPVQNKLISQLKDYSRVSIQPIDLNITAGCKLVSTQPNGVFSKRNNNYSGFSRRFECSDGDVYTRDMTFYGMRKISIKEQYNIVFSSVQGMIYGIKDAHGNSSTILKWVSNGVDHFAQKSGTTEATRAWLSQYAQEVIAKEAK